MIPRLHDRMKPARLPVLVRSLAAAFLFVLGIGAAHSAAGPSAVVSASAYEHSGPARLLHNGFGPRHMLPRNHTSARGVQELPHEQFYYPDGSEQAAGEGGNPFLCLLNAKFVGKPNNELFRFSGSSPFRSRAPPSV